MTSSSSSFANVQVEYSSMPPGLSIASAQSRICFCRTAYSFGPRSSQPEISPLSFRNMPSPEHGASTRILSKKHPNRASSFSGVSAVTQKFVQPHMVRFFKSAFARLALTSFATRSPRPSRREASSVAFPPGAAHRSSTRSPGCTGSLDAGSIALGSCM